MVICMLEIELIFIICYMLFNLGMTSYLIGNMTNFVVHGTSKTRKFVRTLVHTYIKSNKYCLVSLSLIYSEGCFVNREIPFSLPQVLPKEINSRPVCKIICLHTYLCLLFRTDSKRLQQQES